ncbi:hypothetical protein QOZ80_3AG0232330 [Eleusine coracana subsp. coracana]|nr:hypothetical protein QOZ80_3AG0232330 [Eleusine coracana subsp. coracana]
MALSFHSTTAPLFSQGDMASFLQDDVHTDVSDALLGFVYDSSSCNAAIDEILNIPTNAVVADFTDPIDSFIAADFTDPIESFIAPVKEDANAEQHRDKKLRAAFVDDAPYGLPDAIGSSQLWYGTGNNGNCQVPEFPLPLPPLPQQQQPLTAIVRGGAEEKKPGRNCQSAAARERRRRISQKTAELSQLIPGGHRMSTAEMLHEAARHVKLLQAQVGMLALMHSSVGSSSEKGTMPITAAQQEEMHALLMSGRVQERLAAEGKCLVPRKLVDAMAKDKAVKSNPLVNRDLGKFMASLEQQQ